MKIRLDEREYTYLLDSSFARFITTDLFACVKQEQGDYVLNITDECADQMRDLCGEQLQNTGFDNNYKPTKEGEILESLIDKLFVG